MAELLEGGEGVFHECEGDNAKLNTNNDAILYFKPSKIDDFVGEKPARLAKIAPSLFSFRFPFHLLMKLSRHKSDQASSARAYNIVLNTIQA
jgi:hypothetical protein